MIDRKALVLVKNALQRQAAVALIGPRQVGKTTLAQQIGMQSNALYLDLQDPINRAKLNDSAAFLGAFEDRLVILDEVHYLPNLFPTLRGLIDQGRAKGLRNGRFLLLGSASLDLLKQIGESLAGRISYIEMGSLNAQEIHADQINTLWLRGGFPDSFLASTDMLSLAWRQDLLRTYLERDIPMFGFRVPAETLRRFWTMLAHNQGSLLNASRIAASLEISSQSVTRYTDLLVDLLLLRRLLPYHANTGKRLVKSPKTYIRDSGLLHALLNIHDQSSLLGHPIVGNSWEGLVIESLIDAAPPFTAPGFYRTAGGAEIDLVLELPGGVRWAIDVKRSRIATPARGFYEACNDLQPSKAYVVHSGDEAYPLGNSIEAIGLRELITRLEAFGNTTS